MRLFSSASSSVLSQSEDLAPVSKRPAPLLLEATQSKVEELGQRLVIGEVPAVLEQLAQTRVKRTSASTNGIASEATASRINQTGSTARVRVRANCLAALDNRQPAERSLPVS